MYCQYRLCYFNFNFYCSNSSSNSGSCYRCCSALSLYRSLSH